LEKVFLGSFCWAHVLLKFAKNFLAVNFGINKWGSRSNQERCYKRKKRRRIQHCCWYFVFLFLIGIVFDFVRVENEWNEHRGSTKTSKTSLEPTFLWPNLKNGFSKTALIRLTPRFLRSLRRFGIRNRIDWFD